MKKIIGLMILFAFVINNHTIAQLSGTQWIATVNIPGPVKCLFDYRKDTLILMSVDPANDSGNVIETMTYTYTKDTLTIQKISGSSPCGEGDTGKYSAAFKNEQMFLTVIDDPCDARSQAWPADVPFIKVK